MVNIQSAMLVLLGFLVATLLVLLLAPAYWRRAVRLTTFRLKQAMPLTEAEIRADKDRLRAEYAIKVHRLEVKAEETAHNAARQHIELNRRDAAISELEGQIGRQKTALEGHENARRVLEQTITDRIPRLEQRLSEARRLLAQREQEVAQLTETASRQAKALEETGQATAQQRDEMMRLNSSLAAISVRTREGLADPKFDAEVALRTELETLRARFAQQAAIIEQLRAGPSGQGAGRAAGPAGMPVPTLRELDADTVLSRARKEMEAVQVVRAELDKELTAARSAIEDRDAEIARIKAALVAYERGTKDERTISLKDSRIAMKVRIGSLQAETQQQSVTIQRLRTELAGANERLAKQAAHFMAEMRRLGSAPTAPAMRATADAAGPAAETQSRQQLVPKLSALTRPMATVMARARDGATGQGAQDSSRVRGFLKALGGSAAVRSSTKAESDGEAAVGFVADTSVSEPPAAAAEARQPADAPVRLSERIASVTKS